MATSKINRSVGSATIANATANTNVVESGTCYICFDPNARTVRVYGRVNNTDNAVPVSTKIFTIPTAYKPSAQVSLIAYIENNSGGYPGSAIVTTAGEIQQNFSATTKKMVFFGEYTL